jgi:hypothetical protein
MAISNLINKKLIVNDIGIDNIGEFIEINYLKLYRSSLSLITAEKHLKLKNIKINDIVCLGKDIKYITYSKNFNIIRNRHEQYHLQEFNYKLLYNTNFIVLDKKNRYLLLKPLNNVIDRLVLPYWFLYKSLPQLSHSLYIKKLIY